jgi:CO dehydrogenase maturation factor
METFGRQGNTLVAVAGKGGTGKSAITALMAKILTGDGKAKILAIDADPGMGLCNVLGVSVRKTIEDVRREVIRVAGSGTPEEKSQIVNMLDYHIFEAMVEEKRFTLLAMGEPKSAGCFCPANELLKRSIESLSTNFDFVLIDCEAGLEQITRKVVGNITTLLITTDLSMRGAHAAKAIEKAARRFTNAKRIGLIVNRVRENKMEVRDLARETDIEFFGWVPEDSQLSEWDLVGRPIFDLPSDSPSVVAVRQIVEKLNSTL